MGWELKATVQGVPGRTYKHALVADGRAIIVVFLQGGVVAPGRQKFGAMSLIRDEDLNGRNTAVEFGFRQLWYPSTFMSRDVPVNGGVWTLDNGDLLMYEQLPLIYEIWEFVL